MELCQSFFAHWMVRQSRFSGIGWDVAKLIDLVIPAEETLKKERGFVSVLDFARPSTNGDH